MGRQQQQPTERVTLHCKRVHVDSQQVPRFWLGQMAPSLSCLMHCAALFRTHSGSPHLGEVQQACCICLLSRAHLPT